NGFSFKDHGDDIGTDMSEEKGPNTKPEFQSDELGPFDPSKVARVIAFEEKFDQKRAFGEDFNLYGDAKRISDTPQEKTNPHQAEPGVSSSSSLHVVIVFASRFTWFYNSLIIQRHPAAVCPEMCYYCLPPHPNLSPPTGVAVFGIGSHSGTGNVSPVRNWVFSNDFLIAEQAINLLFLALSQVF
ncbi:hypothetical protein Y032_1134g3666, partial [Ancylostoma ceylanicum]